MVHASAIAEISSDGFYLNTNVAIEASLLSVFDLNVTGTIVIDTRASRWARRRSSWILNGSVTVLKVVSLNGTSSSASAASSARTPGTSARASAPGSVRLSMSASGFIASWGSFSFTLTGNVDLTFAGTGIEGTLSAHVSYCSATATATTIPPRPVSTTWAEPADPATLSQKALLASYQPSMRPLRADRG